jgi:Cu+-exporting ATPase
MASEAALERTLLSVEGMTCSACVARVERGLSRIPGVEKAAVNLVSGTAVVSFTPGLVTPVQLAQRVTALGYESHPAPSGTSSAPRAPDHSHRNLATGSLTIFALAMVLGAPLMHVHDGTTNVLAWIAMPFHGLLRDLLPWLWSVSPRTLGWVLLILHLPVVAFGVRPFAVAAWKAAKDRAADMNTLVAAGTLSAFFLSLPSVLAPHWLASHGLPAPLWFESVSGVIGFVALGKWLEGRARESSRGSLLALANLVPAQARLWDGQTETLVSPRQLLPDDLVRVLPGERVPADGIVDGSPTLLDESHLTGEPLPREVVAGQPALAGSLVLQRPLVLRVRTSGDGTTVDRITQLVEQAQSSKAPLQRAADRLAERFAPAVLILAALTLVVWLAVRPDAPMLGITAAISVLVAACPCAMGLAVPSALTVALGRAASLGILVRDAAALETLGRATTILFDKTGTLTEGRPRLLRTLVGPGRDPLEVLALAALAESDSTHPFASAVMDAQRESAPWDGPLPVPSSGSITLAGQGVERPTSQGILAVGRASFAAANQPDLPVAQPGESLVHVSLDGVWAGSLGFLDPLRPEAVALVQALQAKGVSVGLLSGDGPEAVETVAKTLGIADPISRATPESKTAEVLRRRQAGEVVVMVGDGINDAGALAEADVGLAMQSGTAVAFECAQAVLRSPSSVLPAIELGRATVRTVHGNLAWAFGYNILLLPVAAGALVPLWGWMLTPVLAGAAMSLSSVCVMLHSLRLLAFRPTHLAPSAIPSPGLQ